MGVMKLDQLEGGEELGGVGEGDKYNQNILYEII